MIVRIVKEASIYRVGLAFLINLGLGLLIIERTNFLNIKVFKLIIEVGSL